MKSLSSIKTNLILLNNDVIQKGPSSRTDCLEKHDVNINKSTAVKTKLCSTAWTFLYGFVLSDDAIFAAVVNKTFSRFQIADCSYLIRYFWL